MAEATERQRRAKRGGNGRSSHRRGLETREAIDSAALELFARLGDVAERIPVAEGNRALRAVYRSLMTPNRSMANLASGRWPWYRSTRGLDEVAPRQRRSAVDVESGSENATSASEMSRENLPPPPAAITRN